jgi:ATP-dependent DNA helicase RecG
VLEAAATPRTRGELQAVIGLKDRKHFRTTYLDPLLAAGFLEMTLPDPPQSPRQRYRTTAAGTRLLETKS